MFVLYCIEAQGWAEWSLGLPPSPPISYLMFCPFEIFVSETQGGYARLRMGRDLVLPL